MKVSDISPYHLAALGILERVASSLSLLGVFFIAITYSLSPAFHKPINRLVLYASIGNLFTNIATLMSSAFLSGGPACQFQGFLIQVFMPADSYWTLAMACNVYITFYCGGGGKEHLRSMEKWYILACYGLPLIPGAVYLGVTTTDRGPMYGNATLWCWVSNEWDVFRIALFYAPVWVAILVTMAIYIRAGKDIWVKREQLRNFSVPPPGPTPLLSDTFDSPAHIHRKTDISVDYENATPLEYPLHSRKIQYPAAAQRPRHIVTVDITSTDDNGDSRYAGISPHRIDIVSPRRYTAVDANTAIWVYTKVSLLFFLAMMITWMPSSANRLYSVVYPGDVSLPLEYASSLVLPLQGLWNALIYATTSLTACKSLWRDLKHGNRLNFFGIRNMNVANIRDLECIPFDSDVRGLSTRMGVFIEDTNLENTSPTAYSKSSSSRPTTNGSSQR